MTEETKKPTVFAILELFGHARIAGAVSEQTFGGANLIRVDVPEVTFTAVDYDAPRTEEGYARITRTIAAHTRSFGGGAIYAINWCDEPAAVAAAISIRDEPVNPFKVRDVLKNLPDEQRNRLLAAPTTGDDNDGERDEIPY